MNGWLKSDVDVDANQVIEAHGLKLTVVAALGVDEELERTTMWRVLTGVWIWTSLICAAFPCELGHVH